MRNLFCSILLLAIGGLGVVQAEPPLTIAHRGGAIFAPENTIPAFLANIEQSDLIELDVYNTVDGELVVIHDSTVDRTTDGTGQVQYMTLAEIKALDAGSWYAPEFEGTPIPTLEESLAAIGTDSIPLIEHKKGSAGLYYKVLKQLGRLTDVVVQSFDWSFLQSLHTLGPEIPLAALGSGELTEQKVLSIQSMGIPRVAWAHGDVRPEMVEFIHAQGMQLFVWTVNGGTIEKFIDYGVDGIITDDPRLVANLTDTRSSTRHELAQDLVSYWAMDDGLNDFFNRVALDCEGRNPGAIQGDPTWMRGSDALFGGALTLSGTNQYVEIPASESLDLDSNSVTISMWVRLAELPSQIAGSFAGLYDSV
ncbi:MAG: glycerophosphodiester phosphodiesterase family protein, partial [Verrucomicrobiota bacterium]|nr:glycerophosphodiester phosphodiesterase family protein [Verrucomicrobiota bacterium]